MQQKTAQKTQFHHKTQNRRHQNKRKLILAKTFPIFHENYPQKVKNII